MTLVLAHRGASGYRPENTLGAIRLGIEQGADGVEIDVVPTLDGVLVVRHDAELAATTDLAEHPELLRGAADRLVTDLTAAEVATLRARERWPELRPASAAHDGEEPVPTLAEVLEVTAAAGVLLVVEIKQAGEFAALGLDPAPLVAAALSAAPAGARVVLESFEKTPLAALAGAAPRVHLLDDHGTAPDDPLRGYAAELAEPAALADAGFTGVSLPASLADGALVDRLHAAGLEVWAWTLRAEARFLPPGLSRDEHWARVIDSGVDAVFADQPDLVRALLSGRAGAP